MLKRNLYKSINLSLRNYTINKKYEHYDNLNVGVYATKDEILKSFRKLAKVYHP